MKQTIKFYICGYEYSLLFSKKYQPGAEFSSQTIKVCDGYDWFKWLMHELHEVAMMESLCRYYNNGGSGCEYLFVFTHSLFSKISDEITGALEQIVPQLPPDKKKQITGELKWKTK